MSTSWEKAAKKLLLNPHGREALRQYGIDVELAKEETKLDAKPTVVILCPTYRSPEPRMQDALSAAVRYTRERNNAIVYGGPPLSSSVVHWSRNGLISEHLKSGKPWTHALFIDDDIVIQPEDIEKLLSHGKDIVAGLCTRRDDPPIPNIRYFEQETSNLRQIWEWPEDKLIEVGAVGTGLMLITRHALEQVAQAYFDCLWEQEYYKISSDNERLKEIRESRIKHFDETKNGWWFRFLPAFKTPIEYGEDMVFCLMAKRYCDIPVYCDTSIQPGHLGPYPFSIRDFIPYRDTCIEQARREGSYKPEVKSTPPTEPRIEEKISILVPTRKRPDRLREMIDSIKQTARIMPEILCYVDQDDDSYIPASFPEVQFFRGPRITFSDMWNVLFNRSSADIFMLGADDVVFRTPWWDKRIQDAFADCPDKILCVHGDDGHHGSRFGVLPSVHRRWIEALGYIAAPGFGGDYIDTWLNDVANMLGRRKYLRFLAEHKHVAWGTAEPDETFRETRERVKNTNAPQIYADRLKERERDAEKLRRLITEPHRRMEAKAGVG